MSREAVGAMLLKCTWGNICRVYRGMLSYEQVVSIIRVVQCKYIRCYPPICFLQQFFACCRSDGNILQQGGG